MFDNKNESCNNGYTTTKGTNHKMTDYVKMLGKSDDFEQHERIFVKAARLLIDNNITTPQELENHGGWVQSLYDVDAYYVYVGKATNVKDRWFLNVYKNSLSNGARTFEVTT